LPTSASHAMQATIPKAGEMDSPHSDFATAPSPSKPHARSTLWPQLNSSQTCRRDCATEQLRSRHTCSIATRLTFTARPCRSFVPWNTSTKQHLRNNELQLQWICPRHHPHTRVQHKLSPLGVIHPNPCLTVGLPCSHIAPLVRRTRLLFKIDDPLIQGCHLRTNPAFRTLRPSLPSEQRQLSKCSFRFLQSS
jgi:hypothetical protein